MRNFNVVRVAMALMAVALLAATGCKGNPEKAKNNYLQSGLSYLDKKQYDAAEIQFKKALQVDPKFAEAHYQLGLVYLRQQRIREGYAQLNQAARHHLVVCVTLGDPNVRRPANTRPTAAAALYEKMVAQQLLDDRATVLANLTAHGVLTVDTDANTLSPKLIDTYLQLKHRGRV